MSIIEDSIDLSDEFESIIARAIYDFVSANENKHSRILLAEIMSDTLYETYEDERKILTSLRVIKE